MKSNASEVNLVFGTEIRDVSNIGVRFIKSPYSHCDCPAGQMFYPCMLGFLGIMRVIQMKVLLSSVASV
jgi:hypothetical protein